MVPLNDAKVNRCHGSDLGFKRCIMISLKGNFMKRIITIYIKNKNRVQYYLRAALTAFNPSDFEKRSLIQFFETEKAAEIIYAVSSDYKQIDSTYITNPYLHHVSGSPTVTVVKKQGNDFLVIDFDLLKLLEELNLIRTQSYRA
jgi:hypothetical protein